MASITEPVEKLKIFIDVSFNIVQSTKEYYQVSMDFWTQINQKKEVRTVISRHYSKFRENCAKVLDKKESSLVTLEMLILPNMLLL